jgi:DNA-directed RNA polymerase sigma subunit (sigma70/sigma32)
MNPDKLTNRLAELNKSIRFDKKRIADGRDIIRMLQDQIHDSETELRKIKADLKRLEEEKQIESKCNIDISGIWGRMYKLGLSKKEIYVLQNMEAPYREIGQVLGVSVERVRQILRKALRKARSRDIINIIESEVEDIAYSRNIESLFDAIQEQEAEATIFRCA